MQLYSRSCPQAYRPFFRKRHLGALDAGASLVEALVASVIIAIAGAVAITVGNTVFSFVNSTDSQARFSAAIDNDISRVKELAQLYNACNSPTGSTASTGSGCTGYTDANSYFYFPNPSSGTGAADVAAFDSACASSTAATHIVNNFITAVNSVSLPAGVTRSVSKKDSSRDNHLVEIVYSASGGISRVVYVSPYLSFWCP